MNIPVNLFTWAMAFLPIIALIILMIKFHWGATEAAAVGLMITVVTGVFLFKAGVTVIAAESAKGIWNALIILIIVWTAILLYQVGDEAKAFLVIRDGMRKLLPNELLLVFAMGWVIESFLQGITGFGVPVAVGAPLLIGIGVQPIWAVIIPPAWTGLGKYLRNTGRCMGFPGHERKSGSRKQRILINCILDRRFYLVLERCGRSCGMLVLRKRQGC